MIYAHLTQDHIKLQMDKLDGVSVPEICPKSSESEKGKSEKNRIPFLILHGAEGGI